MYRSSSNPAHRLPVIPALAALLTVAAGAAPLPSLPGQIASPPSAQATAPATTSVDVMVVDRDGRPVDGLAPDTFTVTVDGRPRRVLWVRHVSRGPGAMVEASRRQAGRSETLAFAAEPGRTVLMVIDELSIQPGAERAAVQAAAMLVDRLGLDDRVAVLRVPVVRDAQMTLTTERPEVRAALRQVVGQAAHTAARPNDETSADLQSAGAVDPNRASADPSRTTVAQQERPPTEAPAVPKAGEEGPAPTGLIPSLQAVIAAMRSSPGRKVVVVFSAGVPPASAAGVDGVAVAAASSQAVVHVLGLAGARDDPDNPLDTAALDRLARSTGGTFSMLGRNPDKTLERVLPELSACYVLGLEQAAADLDGRRHALRVETSRQSATVRASAWLVAHPDAADVVPAPATPRRQAPDAEPGKPGVVYVGGEPAAGAAPSPEAAARDLELQRLLAKASDYVGGYQREYSMLVAEEHYVQRTRTEQQTLRSDLLLVRPPGLDTWVSFRDVFEVNGRPVRDREERLKRLFLDGSPEAQAQLGAIKDESRRLNIGFARNINVPLYALTFLEAANLVRCQFALSGTKDVAGVSATRVTFREEARPTLVRLDLTQDIAASGWFLIDPASGAVVGTMMQLSYPGNSAVIELTVRYERDSNLGLWVPAEMTEYTTSRGATSEKNLVLDARAEYSRFRRFQVTMETEAKIKKRP
jgi:VWFA-related protein